jgi:hypothetical protein
MLDLFAEISKATELLRQVQPSTLESEPLRQVLEALRDSSVTASLEAYARNLPPEPEDDREREIYRKDIAARADQVNHAAEGYLQELDRIKRMRQTLNLEALDPLIREARGIIHRVHDFTARIQEGN